MFLYDKTNILEGLGIFEVDFAQGHEPASGSGQDGSGWDGSGWDGAWVRAGWVRRGGGEWVWLSRVSVGYETSRSFVASSSSPSVLLLL